MAKRLELLKEIVPSLTRAGVLMLRDLPSNRLILDVMVPTAKELKVELLPIEVSGESDYENALSTAASASIGGLVLTEPPQFEADAAVIASIAERHGLPTVGAPVFAARGGLLGYGVNFTELWRHAATFVDKI
ncbi:MAG TPA: ABC transporter substrate-binding protein, partial [Roseiarcus sp.]|nr:ABC transporter substrate-binding protein [Roseiarcus sp.]